MSEVKVLSGEQITEQTLWDENVHFVFQRDFDAMKSRAEKAEKILSKHKLYEDYESKITTLESALKVSEAKLAKCIDMEREYLKSCSLYRSQGDNEQYVESNMKHYTDAIASITAASLKEAGE